MVRDEVYLWMSDFSGVSMDWYTDGSSMREPIWHYEGLG